MIPLLQNIPQDIISAMWQFLGSLVLLVMIVGISIWKGVGMERNYLWSTLRGFAQILILASVLSFIFTLHGLLPLFGILIVMIIFGAQTAADRLEGIDKIFYVELVSLFVGVNAVMITMSLLHVLPTDRPEFWIPIGGMVTGNSMNISYLTLDRIKSDLKQRSTEIEAALSLGATPEQIMQRLHIIPGALKVGTTPNTNSLRTLGLVFIPGLMTGLLIGGTHPIAAALLQVMIFFLILGGGMLSALIGSYLVTNYIFDMKRMALPVKVESDRSSEDK